MKLTDRACKNAKPKDDPYKMPDGHSMYLLVKPNGSKYWRMKYRFAGKENLLAFGVYPEISISEAREQRGKARKLLKAGIDPSTAKRDEKREHALNATNTFEAVARDWYQHTIEKWSDNHAQTVLRRLEGELFPFLGDRPIRDITAPEIVAVLRKIEARPAYEAARRVMQLCGQVYQYAKIMGLVKDNPAAGLSGALKQVKHGHFAAIESNELPEFLHTLNRNEVRMFLPTRLALELMMLTFVRTSELIKAKWEEFDFEKKRWIIPAERMKMRHAHIVPLSTQVLSRLKQLKLITGHREHLFPAQRNPRLHMSNGAILMALDRMGYRGRMTGHGFRALAMSTIKEHLGYRHEVVDRQLAHAHRNSVDAAYDRAQFLGERTEMMQKWSDYLDTVARENVLTGQFSKAVGD